jgi:hypothetical protein
LQPRYYKFLTYEGKTGNFFTPASPDANGLVSNAALSAGSFWQSSGGVWQCLGGGSNGGWVLSAITRTAAGVPSSITPPLSIQ